MATRFKKLRTRRVLRKKHLKTRKQKGGDLFGFGKRTTSAAPTSPSSNLRKANLDAFKNPAASGILSQAAKLKKREQQVKAKVNAQTKTDADKYEAELEDIKYDIDNPTPNSYIDVLEELNRLVNEITTKYSKIAGRTTNDPALTEDEKRIYKVLVQVTLIPYYISNQETNQKTINTFKIQAQKNIGINGWNEVEPYLQAVANSFKQNS